jgi:hypothetical protein
LWFAQRQIDLDDTGAWIPVPLALQGEVVARELTAGRASMRTGRDAIDAEAPDDELVAGPSVRLGPGR